MIIVVLLVFLAGIAVGGLLESGLAAREPKDNYEVIFDLNLSDDDYSQLISTLRSYADKKEA